jgi:hypothetical protein
MVYRKEYRAKKYGRQSHPNQSQYARKWAQINPDKKCAQEAVSAAVRAGRLVRQPCEKCGAKAHAHHDDYSKPLDVRWLCPKHHTEHHLKILRKATQRTDSQNTIATCAMDC